MTITIDYETSKKLEFDYEDYIHRVIEKAMDYEACPYEAEINVLLSWIAMVAAKNQGRTIDGKTYSESFAEGSKKFIDLDKKVKMTKVENEAQESLDIVRCAGLGQKHLGSQTSSTIRRDYLF